MFGHVGQVGEGHDGKAAFHQNEQRGQNEHPARRAVVDQGQREYDTEHAGQRDRERETPGELPAPERPGGESREEHQTEGPENHPDLSSGVAADQALGAGPCRELEEKRGVLQPQTDHRIDGEPCHAEGDRSRE